MSLSLDADLIDRLTPLPGNPWVQLQRLDRVWESWRQGHPPISQAQPFVRWGNLDPQVPEWDVVVAGGTLGILMALGLRRQGWRVAVLERGKLQGREQEWNISRRELQVLLDLELLTEAELVKTIVSRYNPGRIAFGDGPEFWVKDVLNIGVSPRILLDLLKEKFLDLGGILWEHTSLTGVLIQPQGLTLCTQPQPDQAPQTHSTRLLLDCMGHFSPLIAQARQGQQPDGVCLVIGTCAEGFSKNDTGDLFVSFTPITHQRQYFWEAFPAQDGRTTYLFTYGGFSHDRPSFQTLLQDYWHLLPQYQDVDPQALTLKRLLFGLLPSYRSSPLAPTWPRILAVGDSSGHQSPLSFGGFGAMLRHLSRLLQGLQDALQGDYLDRGDLQALTGYQPNLSTTWLFQKTMGVGPGQTLPENHINQLLAAVFTVMAEAGEETLLPFLQDVVQVYPLTQTLMQTGLRYPRTIAQVIPQVGLPALLDWTKHYLNLVGYRSLHPLSQALLPWLGHGSSRFNYLYRCWHHRLTYGTGLDWFDHHQFPR